MERTATEKCVRTAGPETTAYAGYAGLPPLAGLLPIEDALAAGLTVQQSVDRLKRLHWSLKRLHGILVTRITATPIYELKMAFSLHAHYCAEHAAALAARVREMRQPPYGLEVAPDPWLDRCFDEILAAPTIEELVLGLYQVAIPALIRGFERLLADTHRLFDHPTWRLCRLALVELRDVQEYGETAIRCLVTEAAAKPLGSWTSALDAMLAAAGGLDGTMAPSGQNVNPVYSATPYVPDFVPRRDERFGDPYNMGVNAEAMLFDRAIDPLPKTVMLYFKRMREIDVPEMMATIIAETRGKAWDYYRDMTRQLWDEARHAMMGEIGFVSIGVDWTTIPLNFTWSLGLNTKLTPKERHGVLFAIEQGLMPRDIGKEYEWRVAVASADRLTELIQDYDWADEILHARIGRKWLVPEVGTVAEAQAYGEAAWSRILTDWAKWREEGLTEHRNWWPEVYRAACRHWSVEPDAGVLAYNVTYETVRADLKQIAG